MATDSASCFQFSWFAQRDAHLDRKPEGWDEETSTHWEEEQNSDEEEARSRGESDGDGKRKEGQEEQRKKAQEAREKPKDEGIKGRKRTSRSPRLNALSKTFIRSIS